MSSFTALMSLNPIDDVNWILREPFRFRAGDFEKPDLILTADVGLITDFASIPRIFHTFEKPYGLHGKADIIHDDGYGDHLLPKDTIDDLFYEGMLILGVPTYKAYIMYKAVALCGRSSYDSGPERKHKRQQKFKDLISQIQDEWEYTNLCKRFYEKHSGGSGEFVVA